MSEKTSVLRENIPAPVSISAAAVCVLLSLNAAQSQAATSPAPGQAPTAGTAASSEPVPGSYAAQKAEAARAAAARAAASAAPTTARMKPLQKSEQTGQTPVGVTTGSVTKSAAAGPTAPTAKLSGRCTRLAFEVNDWGKEGPSRDAQALLDKHVATWAAEKGIKKYTIGKKTVNCRLFLDFGFADEHTCRAEAPVCW